MTLAEINALDRAAFVAALGGVFEHSPWIAEGAWARRPFASVDSLHAAMTAVVRASGKAKQLALLRAHPELAVQSAGQPREVYSETKGFSRKGTL